MKRREQPADPVVAAELAAIEAALAGEPGDPRHAETAELALLLMAERPAMDAGAARRLDGAASRRVSAGTASTDAADGDERMVVPRKAGGRPRRWRPRLALPVAGGALVAGVAAVTVAILISSGHHTPPMSQQAVSAEAASSTTSSAQGTPARAAPATAGSAAGSAVAGSAVLGPQQPGRKLVQSAQLQLSTAPDRIDDVAQELFSAVGSAQGFVTSSTVTQTGGPGGSAQIELRVPSDHLSSLMARLSQLPYAHVATRTDAVQDVTGQVVDAGRRLGDARALRTALLKQLASATTAVQIGSVRAQLRDAEAAITRAQGDLNALNGRVSLSSVDVVISAATPAPIGGHGFTIGRALHDAARVLKVVAGVAVLVAALLLPLVGLGGLLWLSVVLLRRRRRERALDLA